MAHLFARGRQEMLDGMDHFLSSLGVVIGGKRGRPFGGTSGRLTAERLQQPVEIALEIVRDLRLIRIELLTRAPQVSINQWQPMLRGLLIQQTDDAT